MEARSSAHGPLLRSLHPGGRLPLPRGIVLHARVWAAQHSLDRALAAGRSAATSPQLALRAEQLTSSRMREGWSTSLGKLVEEFDRPSRPHLSAAVPARREVLDVWREQLLDLAAGLKVRALVCPCGMARLRIVMTDGAGPLLNPHSEASMGELLWWINEGMAQ